jgi:hypothetical protein
MPSVHTAVVHDTGKCDTQECDFAGAYNCSQNAAVHSHECKLSDPQMTEMKPV